MSEAGHRPVEPPPLPDDDLGAISTRQIRAALALVDEHVRDDGSPGSAGPRTGGVVVVVGGPGTGKSLLLAQVIAECRRLNDEPGGPRTPVRGVRIDAAGLDVGAVYGRFVDGLPRPEVLACVRAYHADLSVELITNPDLAARARGVLSDPDLPAAERDDYVSRLGLSQTELLERLQLHLVKVVENSAYAAAFSMLLREGLVGAAWRWLRGEAPAPVLRERGIARQVPGEVGDIVCFARLYAYQDFHLVVVIDDVDQLAFAPDRGGRRLPGFLQDLLRLQDAGALIFVSGRPASIARMGLDRSGSGSRLLLTGFSASALGRFLRAGSRSGTLAPFDHGAVDRLMDVTGGNPRLVADLAVRLRGRAAHQGGEVTAEVVLSESRQYFAVVDRPRAVAAVRRVLDNHSWDFVADYVVAVEPVVRVDFWIRVTTSGPEVAGCAVVIADSVVDDDDLDRLSRLAGSIERSTVRKQTLVVMIGAVSAPHAARLRSLLDREPLTFAADTFDDDMAAAVKSMIQSLEDDSGNPLVGVLDRLGEIEKQLDRQQIRNHALLETVVDGLAGVRSELSALRVSPVGSSGFTEDPAGPVEALCTAVVAQLAALGAPSTVMRGMFAVDRARATATQELRRAFASPDIGKAWGVLNAVTTLVEEFQATAVRWFRTRMPSPGVPLEQRDLNQLDELCGWLADSLDQFPLAELDALRGSGIAHKDWRRRVDMAKHALDRLPDDIRGLVEAAAS